MRITNRFNLPEPFVRAVTFDPYQRVGDISVTELVGAPQRVELERLHDHEIEVDASDRYWVMDGQSIHYVLEAARVPNALQEERLTMGVAGWTISGKPDLYEQDGTLTDYKKTSVWSFVYGDKADWTAQLNLYAVLLRHHGFPVLRLQIMAMLRDWEQDKREEQGYPHARVFTKPVKLWPDNDALAYLRTRVMLHQQARLYKRWYPCTDEERWHRPDSWAVMKKGNKKASAVRPTAKEAWAILGKMPSDPKKPASIVFRPGLDVRCAKGWCNAAPWCEQYTAIHQREQKEIRSGNRAG